MKYSFVYLAGFFFCLLTACKKDRLQVYDDEASGNSIYFPLAESTNQLSYSFGYDKSAVTQTTLRVVIRAIGAPKDFDRPYKLVIADSSTMKKEVDYKILNTETSIRKGKVADTILIQLNRTPVLKTAPVFLYLQLQPNEHFENNMLTRTVITAGTVTEYHFNRLQISSDDIAGPPPFWMEKSPYYSWTFNYLGTFSSLKFQLLINRFNLKVEEVVSPNWFTTGGNYYRLSGWGFGMQAWLNRMEAENNTVYEADGVTKMKMGAGVQ
ncbi:DUF4843 domain-containing protein [Pseudoflavitalea sp. G-6-1-2]|uniref:DUF4843 domain-containing protein n=1 Tax=Pseudoflavitalea sp. G-6-1-2 TaxID=2728841 RepID=UPI00146D30D7|nr:DUF4843 domain-containing protein [Pseudoflavitalea sp. G-6-1-2]NML23029.1 DUF4843 domain-containing protein [Pseudoflavitalea sp. G-6-1-2]